MVATRGTHGSGQHAPWERDYAIERELGAYDGRRGKQWSGEKVKQYSRVMREDFGAHVLRKRYRLT